MITLDYETPRKPAPSIWLRRYLLGAFAAECIYGFIALLQARGDVSAHGIPEAVRAVGRLVGFIFELPIALVFGWTNETAQIVVSIICAAIWGIGFTGLWHLISLVWQRSRTGPPMNPVIKWALIVVSLVILIVVAMTVYLWVYLDSLHFGDDH